MGMVATSSNISKVSFVDFLFKNIFLFYKSHRRLESQTFWNWKFQWHRIPTPNPPWLNPCFSSWNDNQPVSQCVDLLASRGTWCPNTLAECPVPECSFCAWSRRWVVLESLCRSWCDLQTGTTGKTKEKSNWKFFKYIRIIECNSRLRTRGNQSQATLIFRTSFESAMTSQLRSDSLAPDSVPRWNLPWEYRQVCRRPFGGWFGSLRSGSPHSGLVALPWRSYRWFCSSVLVVTCSL